MLLLRALGHCPLAVLQAIGAVLGWVAWLASPTYRQRLSKHAALAGVGRADARAAIAHAGRMTAEVPWAWRPQSDARIARTVQWQGAEHVDAALARGKGLMLVTLHLGGFELSAQAYAARFGARHPITVLYRPARQAWLAAWSARARQRPGMCGAPTTLAGVRQLLRALRSGQAVGVLPDQVPPQGQGVWAPFFGQSAYTMTLVGRLAAQTGATLLLARCERVGRARFVLHIEPWPDQPAADSDEATFATALNAALERQILQAPAQYLWGYARYKTPPAAPHLTPNGGEA